MKTIYIKPNNIKLLTESFEKVNADKRVNSFLVFMADKNSYKKEELEILLKSSSKKVLGGIFYKIIYNGVTKKEGLIIIPSTKVLITTLFSLKDTSQICLNKLLNQYNRSNQITGTLLVFMHAFGDKSTFLDSLFNYFGNYVHYLGAGSGSVNDQNIASIFNNNGIHNNAGIIGLMDEKLDIGVAHGWHPISDALKVTKTEGLKIVSLNWEPAFNVYKENVEKHSNQKFLENNYLEISKSYPLGLAKIDSEMLIRDTMEVENTSLVLIEKIQEGEYINIMYGNKESLLKGAKNARKKISYKNENDHVFCIDCLSRHSLLDDEFYKELEILNENGNVDGVISLGEIGNTGESFLESYNNTVIVAKW